MSSNIIYLADGSNTIYQQDMTSGNLSTMFRSYHNRNLPILAITVANQSGYSDISSEDSEGFGSGIIYTLQQNQNIGILTAFTMAGSFLCDWQFTATNDILLSICVWPGDGNLLLVNNSTQIYFLSINTTGILSTVAVTAGLPFSMGRGLSIASRAAGSVGTFYITDTNAEPVLWAISINSSVRTVALASGNYVANRNHPLLVGVASIYNATPNLSGYNSTIYTFEKEQVGGVCHQLLGGAPEIPTGERTKIRLHPFISTITPTAICGMETVTSKLTLPATTTTINVTTNLYTSATVFTPLADLFFGNLKPGGTSAVQVIALSVTGVQQISNVKLGIMATNFGSDLSNVLLVKSENAFNPTDVPLTGFSGINTSGLASDPNNVEIGTLPGVINPTTSAFVNLAVKCPTRLIGQAAFEYRWFFDFVD